MTWHDTVDEVSRPIETSGTGQLTPAARQLPGGRVAPITTLTDTIAGGVTSPRADVADDVEVEPVDILRPSRSEHSGQKRACRVLLAHMAWISGIVDFIFGARGRRRRGPEQRAATKYGPLEEFAYTPMVEFSPDGLLPQEVANTRLFKFVPQDMFALAFMLPLTPCSRCGSPTYAQASELPAIVAPEGVDPDVVKRAMRLRCLAESYTCEACRRPACWRCIVANSAWDKYNACPCCQRQFRIDNRHGVIGPEVLSEEQQLAALATLQTLRLTSKDRAQMIRVFSYHIRPKCFVDFVDAYFGARYLAVADQKL